MIAKVGKSTSIPGTIKYLLGNKERVAWTEAYNLADSSESFVISQMQTTAEVSKTIKPMYHLSVSWDPGDQPTQEQMFDSAKQILSDLGLSDHEALIVAHNDKDYPHLHLAVNRVHPETGKAWETWKDYHRLEKSLRAIEKQIGWREVPGHHYRLAGQVKPAYGISINRKESEQIKRGELPFSKLVHQVVGDNFREATSWNDLHTRLNKKGLYILKGRRGTGGRITDGNEITNLSKIHRSFSMNNLVKRFGPFHDFPNSIHKQYPDQPEIAYYAGLEMAKRLGISKKEEALSKALKASIKIYKSANSLNEFLKVCTSLSSPKSFTLKAITKMVNSAAHHITKQSKQIDRGIEY